MAVLARVRDPSASLSSSWIATVPGHSRAARRNAHRSPRRPVASAAVAVGNDDAISPTSNEPPENRMARTNTITALLFSIDLTKSGSPAAIVNFFPRASSIPLYAAAFFAMNSTSKLSMIVCRMMLWFTTPQASAFEKNTINNHLCPRAFVILFELATYFQSALIGRSCTATLNCDCICKLFNAF